MEEEVEEELRGKWISFSNEFDFFFFLKGKIEK